MQDFAKLLDALYFTSSTRAKSAYLRDYFASTPDPDRGWAVAAIAGTLSFDFFKRQLIRELITERVDPTLFELCYDYVGETSETVAHLWPSKPLSKPQTLPSLSELVETFKNANRDDSKQFLIQLLDQMTASQRWALIKLGTRGLRIGVSARSLKKALAEFGNVAVEDIEEVWHALEPPYTELFQWLENKADKPDISGKNTFRPVMLAHPLEESDYDKINADQWLAEWKYDGIRVQLVCDGNTTALYSRTGDDISHSFPDIAQLVPFHAVIDGELLVKTSGEIGSFNDLQQRLNKKKPSKKLVQQLPAHIIAYDILSKDGVKLTNEPLVVRRQLLEQLLTGVDTERFSFSQSLSFTDFHELQRLRQQALTESRLIEGIMLKRQQGVYVTGRPKGEWYKWKRPAKLVDAILMYAQRGHGKRSSFYSDYTFGLWAGDSLLPIGKAYSGFTDDELKKLDKWVRENTIGRFGPVREVEKQLVFEVAYDSLHESNRHKSGIALRFPRINRIRWDKPAAEVQPLNDLIHSLRAVE